MFTVIGSSLYFKTITAFPKFAFNLKIRVGLGKLVGSTFEEYQYFYDFISVKVNRSLIPSGERAAYDDSFSTYFWKHGQAGIFDISTPILPTKWYNKQEKFEYEFIVVDNPNFHKIYDNLMILSNNAEPDSFEFEVIGDVYDVIRNSTSDTLSTDTSQSTTLSTDVIKSYQKAKNIKTLGRMRGNMHYKEDVWDVEIKPFKFKQGSTIKEARIRDKYCRIKVRYSGEKLAIITALQTLYTQSYA